MGQSRGLVMEVNKRSCIILTGNGQFLEVAKPRGGVEPGQEIVVGRSIINHFNAAYLAVASLIVVVLAWWVFNTTLPRAMAYVALDINPSIELAIAVDNEIISAKGVNADGQELLQRVAVVHEPLAKGVQKIITGCVEYDYLNPGQENLVLVTVTDAKGNKTGTAGGEDKVIKEVHDCVYTSINKSIDESGIDAELIVADTDIDTMEKAHANGVTPGRYLLQKEARKKGVQITSQELKEEHLRELEVKKHFRTKELIQKRPLNAVSEKTGSTDKSGSTGKTGKSDKYDSYNEADRHTNYVKLNRPFLISSVDDSTHINYQTKPFANVINQTNAFGKQFVQLDNGYLMGKTWSKRPVKQINKEDSAKQNSTENNQTNPLGKQYVSRDNSYILEKTVLNRQVEQINKEDSSDQNPNKNSQNNVLEKQTEKRENGYFNGKISSNNQLKQLNRAEKTKQNSNKNLMNAREKQYVTWHNSYAPENILQFLRDKYLQSNYNAKQNKTR